MTNTVHLIFNVQIISLSCVHFFLSLTIPVFKWRNFISESTVNLVKIILLVTATAKSLQTCPTLCDPIDGSPPGSPVPGILQARTLEWVAISFSNAWNWKVKVKSLSCVWLLETPWTTAYQASLSMGFSRQEHWSGVPLLSPEDLPDPSFSMDEVTSLSRVRLFATPWTVARQAPPSMGFSRQEYWSGLPFPSPGDLPDPGIEPRSPALQADALTSEPPGKPFCVYTLLNFEAICWAEVDDCFSLHATN